MSEVPATASATSPTMLFYKRPEPLVAATHGELSLRQGTGFGFAADTNAVPIMASEFADAGRFYPIVFAGERPMPCVVLGLDHRNLFVANDGRWRDGCYIPAYVRRYPFVFFTAPQDGKFVLGIDTACDQIIRARGAGEDSKPLFNDGKPTQLTVDALSFSSTMQAEHQATASFAAALQKHDLLAPRQAEVELPSGRRICLPGFFLVDPGRFQALPDAVVLDWHQNGWLALVRRHLDSQARWGGLLPAQAERDRNSENTEERAH